MGQKEHGVGAAWLEAELHPTPPVFPAVRLDAGGFIPRARHSLSADVGCDDLAWNWLVVQSHAVQKA